MEKIKHNAMNILVGSKGHFYLSTKDEGVNGDFEYGHINSNLTLNSNYEAEYKGINVMPTGDFYEFVGKKDKENGFVTEYSIPKWNLSLLENVTTVKDMNVLVQNTTVVNDSKESFDISGISSAQALGIGIGGSKYFEKDRFRVHYCRSTWCCEGQWVEKSLEDLCIFPGSTRVWEISKFRISDRGSFSTQEYYPIMIIEDKEEGNTWFFESESQGSWYIELQACSGWLCPFLCVVIGGADEREGFRHTLKAGESYTTQNAFYGVVKGGFNEAVQELLKYKRATTTKRFDTVPVCFNDFLNCLWAEPTTDRILPLVDKASEIGCEYYIIDAGWARDGEWVPYGKEIFGDLGFEGVMNYIKEKGMKPGVWFEFETTSFAVAEKLGIEDYLLTRNGKIICDHRPKVNMRNPKVRAYLKERIKHVYDLGVRFIKNDHNNSEKFGSTYYGECPYLGTLENVLATAEFIEEIQRDFEGLVIENCCAGAGREAHGMLKHCYLQSYSDQEDYRLAPTVAIGQIACIPPEKTGIWSSPYPLLNDMHLDVDSKMRDLTPEDVAKMVDGEQTAFNMVTSMIGLMYMSGKIYHADELNTELMKEGVAVYKSYRNILNTANPVFIEKLKHVTDKTHRVHGVESADKTTMYLAVWNLEEGKFDIDLTKYGYKTAELIYPTKLDGVKWKFNGKNMKFNFTKSYSARLFKLSK